MLDPDDDFDIALPKSQGPPAARAVGAERFAAVRILSTAGTFSGLEVAVDHLVYDTRGSV